MMYGYGAGAWWMMLMPLLWIALLALIVWAIIRLTQSGSTSVPSFRETPRQILDRRYAQGDLGDEAYLKARAHLSGQEPGQS